MKNIKSQAGWTMWSLLFTLSTVGFFAFVGMQLVPVYNSNSSVKNAMKISVRDLDTRRATRSQVIKGIQAQLYLDGGNDFISSIDFKKALKLTRDNNYLTIDMEYDRTVPLFANISIFVEFKPSLKCNFEGACIESVLGKK
jgi:hypothetical protein